MPITQTRQGDVTILRIQGELAGSVVGEFRKLVEPALARDQRDFCIDFSQAMGVDSRGLEALTALKRSCEERLGKVKVCGLSPAIETVFAITRLNRTFECLPDAESAVASFG